MNSNISQAIPSSSNNSKINEGGDKLNANWNPNSNLNLNLNLNMNKPGEFLVNSSINELNSAQNKSEEQKIILSANRCELLVKNDQGILGQCKNKLTLMKIKCKCGMNLCMTHRYPEDHKCQFDFQKDNENKLRNSLGAANFEKVKRI
jgi:hypothetical protein